MMHTLLGLLLVLGASLVLANPDPTLDPEILLKKTSDQMLEEILGRKQELIDYPGRIYPLVEEIVLPRFDFILMSRLVLGKHWNLAKEVQKRAFVEAFRVLLVRTYAMALLNYSGQKIEYLPRRKVPGEEVVKVKTLVREDGAQPIPIDYRLKLKDGDWLIYDVVIDGVSLLSNYRTGYSSKIRHYKLDGLIERLEKRNRE